VYSQDWCSSTELKLTTERLSTGMDVEEAQARAYFLTKDKTYMHQHYPVLLSMCDNVRAEDKQTVFTHKQFADDKADAPAVFQETALAEVAQQKKAEVVDLTAVAHKLASGSSGAAHILVSRNLAFVPSTAIGGEFLFNLQLTLGLTCELDDMLVQKKPSKKRKAAEAGASGSKAKKSKVVPKKKEPKSAETVEEDDGMQVDSSKASS
jgi:hypothetical protein